MTSNESNAQEIRLLIEQLQGLIAGEEGWEPKTARDYRILTWAGLQELRGDVKSLKGLYDRVMKLESNQSVFAGLQAGFTIIAATIAGYFGMRR